MIENRTFIVVGMEHYNPLGVIRSLGKAGITPVYIAIEHKCPIASLSKYVGKVHYVKTVEEAYKTLVSEYGRAADEKPFVITTDDDIQSLLDMHYEQLQSRFIFFNSGVNGRTTYFMDKKRILDLAKKHDLPVLKTVVVEKGCLPSEVDYPVITKSISPNIGGWKADVHICNNETELSRAFACIQSPQVLIQRYVKKDNEICIEGFSCNRGRDLFMPAYTTYNYNIDGYYSPYMTVHAFDLDGIGEKLSRMMKEIGFEGIFEAEFLVDENGAIYFSEINFRNSTWSYAATKLGMPLPVLWAKAMENSAVSDSCYKPIPKNYLAMVEPIDYQKRVVEGGMCLGDWLVDFRTADCLYYLDMNDIEPFRQMVSNWKTFS